MGKLNKVIGHFCGGAGINISASVFEDIAGLGDGFADVVFNYIDTSTNNIDEIEKRGEFYAIESLSHGGKDINGSGGERRTNASSIAPEVKGYLDKLGYHVEKTGEYHIVVFSGSGGSGSVIGPNILRNLLERKIPVVAVVIGDTSNGLSALNTRNTIGTLEHITTKIVKAALPVVYINNTNVGGNANGRKKTNEMLYSSLSTVALFLSGINKDIDGQDMVGFFSPSSYNTISVSPGIYGLSLYGSGTSIGDDESIPIIGRTLSIPGVDTGELPKMLHHKDGHVVSDDAITIYKGQFPLHMVLHANYFKRHHDDLAKVIEEYEQVASSVRNDTMVDVGTASDDGMIF